MLRNNNDNYINSTRGRMLVLLIFILIVGIVLLGRIFYLQIVHGEEALNDFTLKIQKERVIDAARGNIYDRNGKPLAYNVLAYNVTIEDIYESGKDKNKNINDTLIRVLEILKENDDKPVGDFDIFLNDNDEFEFSVSDMKLKRFLADVYGVADVSSLKYEMETATAEEVMEYLCSYKKFGIGNYTDPENPNDSFIVGDGYTKKEMLQLATIRYSMSFNSYQKYIPTVIASDVSEKTVSTILENSVDLLGVSITENSVRKYNDSVCFAQIMGYTGKISEEELENLNNMQITDENIRTTKARNDYVLTDMVGKSGIEQTMETYLAGTKGREYVYVNNLGKVIDIKKTVTPLAGNDVYLTIDRDLQVATYNILEQFLAGVLVSKIINVMEYKPDDNTKASNFQIAIGDVYFQLFNNNVIDMDHFDDADAGENEKAVLAAIDSKRESVTSNIRQELTADCTPYKDLPDEYKVYESFITTQLIDYGVLLDREIDKEDETYLAWKLEETISLSEYLRYAISQNWIDVSKIHMDTAYADSDEVFYYLVDYIIESLESSKAFTKKMIKYMIIRSNITPRQICAVLLEQDAVSIIEKEKQKFWEGMTTPYDFMLYLIGNLYITPAQLALDPYSASCVITNVDGEVLALVSYPSYDNNKLANSIDAEYYAKLQTDLSKPLWNYATQQKTAPGSTYKMVSSTAALQEKIINTESTFHCSGYFDRFENEQYHCWIYPGSHGSLNVSGAIENSCNDFFYEVGYQLSIVDGKYNEQAGLNRLNKYAIEYGLNEKSGIEIEESLPECSDEYPVLSAIGQGTNNFTTVSLARYVTAVANSGTVYNLTLLDKVTDSNGNEIVEYSPSVRNNIDLPNSAWNAIHRGMRNVVVKKSYFSELGVNVAGKTGTAQESKSRTNHALFVSYAPYEEPEIVVCTRIAFGYTSEYAANVTRDIYRYYYKLDEEDSILTGAAEVPEASITNAD